MWYGSSEMGVQRERRRKIPELLAPAGGPEAFYAALSAGADAIYCGLGNDFNARRGARNFDDESFKRACRDAHLAGVRVYVTENIVVKQSEMSDALALVQRAWGLGADAVIIQDIGLMAEVKRLWPEVELHVSTQANVHDTRGALFCRDVLSADRVTLSRELSLAEIARIADAGVDVEVFGHGALCFCYSGICMMSSLAGGRSANRGLCAQPCRLPYDLVDSKGNVVAAAGRTRPLCPKDCCTIEDLPQLIDSHVSSLKIEGRMKAPDYVWAVVATYRAELDDLATGQAPTPETAARRRRMLKRSFNRDFTDAYLHGRSGDEMMSYERSNNRGELVGSVSASRDLGTYRRARTTSVSDKQRVRSHHYAEATVRFEKSVGAGDLLEIRPTDDPAQFLTTHADKSYAPGQSATLRVVRPMPIRSPVRVIRSQAILDEAARASAAQALPRRAVTVCVEAHRGQPLSIKLTLLDADVSVCALGQTVESARTKELTREELVEHVCRMGSSPFDPVDVHVHLDSGCGMAFSAIHEVRRRACKLLEQKLLAGYERSCSHLAAVPSLDSLALSCAHARSELRKETLDHNGVVDSSEKASPVAICALVTTPEAAHAAVAAGATRIYASADALATGAWPQESIAWLDEICREQDHARLDSFVQPHRPVAVGNLSELSLAARRSAFAEVRPCIPVHNESCLVKLEVAGACGLWLSPELTLEEIRELAPAASVPLGLIVSGRTRAMTSEHCILQTTGRCVHDCARCPLRAQRLSLRDRDGALLPVRSDLHGRSRIYAAHPLDITPQIPDLMACGVVRFMADCTLLSVGETSFAVGRVERAVAAALAGRKSAPRLAGATSGHFFSGVG